VDPGNQTFEKTFQRFPVDLHRDRDSHEASSQPSRKPATIRASPACVPYGVAGMMSCGSWPRRSSWARITVIRRARIVMGAIGDRPDKTDPPDIRSSPDGSLHATSSQFKTFSPPGGGRPALDEQLGRSASARTGSRSGPASG